MWQRSHASDPVVGMKSMYVYICKVNFLFNEACGDDDWNDDYDDGDDDDDDVMMMMRMMMMVRRRRTTTTTTTTMMVMTIKNEYDICLK